jgi:hypothetical protein
MSSTTTSNGHASLQPPKPRSTPPHPPLPRRNLSKLKRFSRPLPSPRSRPTRPQETARALAALSVVSAYLEVVKSARAGDAAKAREEVAQAKADLMEAETKATQAEVAAARDVAIARGEAGKAIKRANELAKLSYDIGMSTAAKDKLAEIDALDKEHEATTKKLNKCIATQDALIETHSKCSSWKLCRPHCRPHSSTNN